MTIVLNMNYIRENNCCGIAELADIGGENTERLCRYVAENIFEEQKEIRDNATYYNYSPEWEEANYQCPFLFFTDINHCIYGERLYTFIKKNKLGTVHKTQKRVNPRSGNQLRMYVWTLKKQALKKWYEKQ